METVDKILTRLKEKTKTEFIRIRTVPDKETTLSGSKFGGVPYWENIEDYPKTKDGERLILLAQINFADLPKNTKFPSEGLLQFFFCPDDMYGMNYYHPDCQDTFRIVYHENVKDIKPLDGVPTTLDVCSTPVHGESALEFSLDEEYISPSVYNFNNVFSEVAKEFGVDIPEQCFLLDFIEEDVYNDLYEKASGHKLLGYPYFTQYDPRYAGDNNKDVYYDTLLFQIDTEKNSDFYVLFGDCGIANFFMNHDDLEKLDFSKVYYNWDCL